VIGRQLTLGVRATPAGGDALALDTLVTLVDDAP
jgi:hypothetical protein